jgi:hypothetical protein
MFWLHRRAAIKSWSQLRWIVAALRHHRFFSPDELNAEIRHLPTRLNDRKFRKREGSRASVFVPGAVGIASSARPAIGMS